MAQQRTRRAPLGGTGCPGTGVLRRGSPQTGKPPRCAGQQAAYASFQSLLRGHRAGEVTSERGLHISYACRGACQGFDAQHALGRRSGPGNPNQPQS